jgi:hypothetical protein
MNIDTLFQIFSYGIDYGQLLMEEERDNEDNFDAFQCFVHDQKTTMASGISLRRKPHSQEWRDAKRASYDKFIAVLAMANTQSVIKE